MLMHRPKSILPFNSYTQRVEDRALACVELCRERLGLREVPLPVPVEEWIERPMGIGFGIQNLAHLGVGVLGAAFIKENEIAIDERVLSNEGRYRFTCAHELGHLVLHAKVKKVFTDQSLGDAPQVDKFERQADRFAAGFLMPVPLLIAEFFTIAKTIDGPRKAVECALMDSSESEQLWKRCFLPQLQSRFAVSRRALMFRLGEIRLADGNAILPQEVSERILCEEMTTEARTPARIFPGQPQPRKAR